VEEGALLPDLLRESIQTEKEINHALAAAIPFQSLRSIPLPDGFLSNDLSNSKDETSRDPSLRSG
jgi:hypothetical protein